MDLDRLEKLAQLKTEGAITEEEFQREKRKMMGGQRARRSESPTKQGEKFGLNDDDFNMCMHLSQFCSILVPLLGILAPLALWMMNKEHDHIVDQHGRNILNWSISVYIYLMVCGLLIFVFIGLFLIWIPLALSVIFPIIGAIKAKDGVIWKYPLSIPFFSSDN